MKEELERFLRISDKLFRSEHEQGVVKPVEYQQLTDILDLNLEDKPLADEVFEEAITKLVLMTPRTQTTQFYNQLFGGRRPKAYLGELLAVLLNNSMYTYKVGGPMIAVEKNILKEVARLVGFKSETEGTIAPGGSMTNYMGMLMARDKYDGQARYDGPSKKLIAYTSKESHYSVWKNAAFCGIGRNNVRVIESDAKGKMDCEVLENTIRKDIDKGYIPCFINATAGTTVLGAYDDLERIADIRDRFGMWLHVDAAYGGAAMFTPKYQHLLKGAERSDSFSFNAHKMLGTPITCSIIITRHKKCLYDSFSNEASYLYQGDQDEINPGKISLQCGRRNDALKFWALWKSLGTEGLGHMVEHEFDLAEYAREYIRSNSDYTLYSYKDSVNICFNYKKVSPEALCDALNRRGDLMVGYGKFREDVFVRLVMVNANLEKSDIDKFFSTLERTVETL